MMYVSEEWIMIKLRVSAPRARNFIQLYVSYSRLRDVGFSDQVTVRYVGVYLATGAYVSNWAALNSYQANNITGQEVSHLTSLNTQLTISQPMEASGYSSRSNSMQRTGWCCWQLHCPTKGSSSLYHGGLDLHRVGIENRH